VKKATSEMDFFEIRIVQEAAKLAHQAFVEVVFILVLSAIYEVEISIQQPEANAHLV